MSPDSPCLTCFTHACPHTLCTQTFKWTPFWKSLLWPWPNCGAWGSGCKLITEHPITTYWNLVNTVICRNCPHMIFCCNKDSVGVPEATRGTTLEQILRLTWILDIICNLHELHSCNTKCNLILQPDPFGMVECGFARLNWIGKLQSRKALIW